MILPVPVLVLRLLPRGNVLSGAQGRGNVACFVTEDRVMPGDDALLAAFRDDGIFVISRKIDLSLDELVKYGPYIALQPFRHEVVDPCLPDDLFFRVSQDLRALPVDERYPAFPVENADDDPGHIQVFFG